MKEEEPASPTMGSDEASLAASTAAVGGGGDDDDEVVLQFLDSLDGYLTRMDSLSSTLRQGWFELACARQSMGPSRISSALLDLNVKSAPTTLQMTVSDAESLLEPGTQFSLAKWASSRDEKCSSSDAEDKILQTLTNSSQIRRRGSSHLHEADREINSTNKRSPVTTDNDKQKERIKSLAVYGTLVSPKLRAAQGSFETALETIVEIANLRSMVLSTYSRLRLENAA